MPCRLTALAKRFCPALCFALNQKLLSNGHPFLLLQFPGSPLNPSALGKPLAASGNPNSSSLAPCWRGQALASQVSSLNDMICSYTWQKGDCPPHGAHSTRSRKELYQLIHVWPDLNTEIRPSICICHVFDERTAGLQLCHLLPSVMLESDRIFALGPQQNGSLLLRSCILLARPQKRLRMHGPQQIDCSNTLDSRFHSGNIY